MASHGHGSGSMYKRIRSLSDKRRILAEYQDLEHPMLEAVKKGDAVGVQRLAMNLGSDAVNEQDAEGWTPLHEASTRGRADIVKVLLNFQANPNVLSQFHRAPLHNAAASGVVAVAELLLEAGASIDPRNNEQWTPLHRACKQQRIDMAVFLVSRGANVSALTDKGETPTDLLVSFANKQRVLAAAGNEDAIRWIEVHSHEEAGAHKVPCPRCGIQMNSKFNFCGMCGARMHGSPTATPTSPTQRPLRTSHDPTQLAL